jgi:hypothetical protein
MKMSSAVDGYSGKMQVGVGGTGAAPVLAQTSEAKQIKTRPSAHNSGRVSPLQRILREKDERKAICFLMYTVSSRGRLQEIHRAASATTPPFVIPHAPACRGSEAGGGPPQKTRPTTTLGTPCLVAWLDFGGSVRLKRLMRRMGGSVRLKRLMRHKGRIGRCFCRFSGFGALRGCRRRWFART